jgi:hypothetical protein
MSLVNEAKLYVQNLPVGGAERLILEFLLQNGIGRHNAQTWATLDKHLRQNGHHIRQQAFQQGLLKRSRESSVFIGSNDHGEGRGYFLIQDREDAELMRQWYCRRIQVEQEHLDQLDRLIQKHFAGAAP